MKISDFYSNPFLKPSDIPEGKNSLKLTIKEVTQHTFKDSDEPKPVMSFVETKKKLVLGPINADIISQKLGDDTEKWGGNQIELKARFKEYQGVVTEFLRVVAVFATSKTNRLDKNDSGEGGTTSTERNPSVPKLEITDDDIPF